MFYQKVHNLLPIKTVEENIEVPSTYSQVNSDCLPPDSTSQTKKKRIKWRKIEQEATDGKKAYPFLQRKIGMA